MVKRDPYSALSMIKSEYELFGINLLATLYTDREIFILCKSDSFSTPVIYFDPYQAEIKMRVAMQNQSRIEKAKRSGSRSAALFLTGL